MAYSIDCRDKREDYFLNHLTVKFKSGKKLVSTSKTNMYQKGFLDNVYLRPSCYECAYAKIPRVGDISLADFWWYDGNLLERNKNQGISIVAVNSENGKEMFSKINNSIIYEEVDKEYAKARSRHLHMKPK